MKFGPAFVRSLIFVWLATWVPADPIALLQVFLVPSEDTVGTYAFRRDSNGGQFARHHSEALISSSTEGSDQRNEESQADEDEGGASSHVEQRRLDPAVASRLAVGAYSSKFYFSLTPPRAPPALSL